MNPEQITYERYKPKGTDASLPHGGLPEVISPHIDALVREMEAQGLDPSPIILQFWANTDAEHEFYDGIASDPLLEDQHRVSESAIVKYEPRYNEQGERQAYGRMLWLVTHRCATYCRYCTRGRVVGTGGAISKAEADTVIAYLREHDDVNEVILSGGDPLTLNPKIFRYIMEQLGELQREGKLDVIRIGTRFPIHNPTKIPQEHFESLKLVEDPRIMLHVNHPAELTPETLAVLKRFRHECHALIKSQSVLLKGVNYFEDADGKPDSTALRQLFEKLAKHGISPYYVFQNDEVYWAKHFTVPIRKAIAMWQQLRPNLSGDAATARLVIDVEEGNGKIAVPEGGAWQVDYEAGFTDFKGKKFMLDDGRTAIAVE